MRSEPVRGRFGRAGGMDGEAAGLVGGGVGATLRLGTVLAQMVASHFQPSTSAIGAVTTKSATSGFS